MKQVSLTDLKKKAKEASGEDKNWHYHILTPGCVFNRKVKHAVVLEDVDNDEQYVSYSVKDPEKERKNLAKLVGDKKDTKKKKDEKKPTEKAKEIIKRAKKLNSKNVEWHYHLLSPDCVFNTEEGKWKLLFEDSVAGEVLESVSKQNPVKAKEKIGKLFSEQKR